MLVFVYVFTEKLNLTDVKGFNYLSKSGLDVVKGTNYCTQFQSIIVSGKQLVLLSAFDYIMLSK